MWINYDLKYNKKLPAADISIVSIETSAFLFSIFGDKVTFRCLFILYFCLFHIQHVLYFLLFKVSNKQYAIYILYYKISRIIKALQLQRFTVDADADVLNTFQAMLKFTGIKHAATTSVCTSDTTLHVCLSGVVSLHLTLFTPTTFWNPHYIKTCLISLLPWAGPLTLVPWLKLALGAVSALRMWSAALGKSILSAGLRACAYFTNTQ